MAPKQLPMKLLMAALLVASSNLASAQSFPSPSRVYGVSDTDVPTPTHSTKTASDVPAIQAIIDFVKLSAVTGWSGLTADGTITFAGDPASYPAHLSLLGSDKCRLDVTKASGVESTIYNGSRGVFKTATGEQRSISSDISMLGLVAFPHLFAPDYPAKASVLADQGTAAVGGKSLHRITLDDPAPDGTGLPWKTADLYFDTQTNRLVESTAFVHLASSDAALYMLETTYDDYRPEGLGSFAHTYTQSLNGNLQWTLQLTTVNLSAAPAGSLFQF